MNVPGYWMNETSGVLRPVVEKYLRGEELEPLEVGTMRAYLRQWMTGDFYGAGIARLRAQVEDGALLELLRSLPELDGTGFADRDLDRLLAQLDGDDGELGRDTEPGPRPAEPSSRPGDLYRLGEHRLLCGDATDPAAFERLLGDDRAAMVWTDPPYGVSYQVNLPDDPGYARRRRPDGLVVPGDELGEAAHEAMLRAALGNALTGCSPGAAWYVAAPAGPRVLAFARVLHELGVFREALVWVKDSFVFGRQDYHWQHETVLYGWKPGGAHYWNAGRTETTVRDDEPDPRSLDKRELVALVRQLRNERCTTVQRIDRPHVSPLHPTMKPVDLVGRHLLNSSRRHELVLDPFGGAGTTAIAAANLGRRARCLEVDPGYCDVIVNRWRRHTGGEPELDRPASSSKRATSSKRAR